VTPRFMINPYAQPMLALAAGSKEPDGVQNATGQLLPTGLLLPSAS
jgi:hypothetical protein